jgi:SLOG-like protein
VSADEQQGNPGPFSVPRQARPLEGIRIGISVALGEDSAQYGIKQDEMNALILRLSEALLSAGACLVFGHDWRPKGVMSAVASLAVAFDPGSTASNAKGGIRSSRITNLVAWDQMPELPLDLREDLEKRGILRVEQVNLPDELAVQFQWLGRRTMRAAALSILRQRLASICDARICLGGKYQKYEGFWPGILEESYLSATVKRSPVLLSGLLGGASELILRASKTNQWERLLMPTRDEELAKGFKALANLEHLRGAELADASEVLRWESLQERSRLSESDWDLLAGARDIKVVAALSIKALQK